MPAPRDTSEPDPTSPAPLVVHLRGHSINPWDLRPWENLTDRYRVDCLVTDSNEHDVAGIALRKHRVRAVRDALPAGRIGNAIAYAAGDRYLGLESALTGADIVHSADLHTWFSAQAARLRERLGFRLVLTVWETIPFLATYRWPRERRARRDVLGNVDLYLPASERARRALLLEGVPDDRIVVSAPGIDTAHFESAARAAANAPPAEHLILSPGRLVWEKGHQDAIRAVAALQRGLLGKSSPVRLLVVGSGPERARLGRYVEELGAQEWVEFRSHVSYERMPELYARASAMVLASLPRRGWEEQFGMVLAEALASGTRVCAARSGAIAEVVGPDALLFEPGDWWSLAELLRDGPLATAPGARVQGDARRIHRYSAEAAADRIDRAYRLVLRGST